MAIAFEIGAEEDRCDLLGECGGNDARADRQHVGVVVEPRHARRVEVVAQRRPGTVHLVGRDLLALARPTEHDADVGGTSDDGPGDGRAVRRVVAPFGAVGAEVVDGVAGTGEEFHQVSLQVVSGVVGTDRDPHPAQCRAGVGSVAVLGALLAVVLVAGPVPTPPAVAHPARARTASSGPVTASSDPVAAAATGRSTNLVVVTVRDSGIEPNVLTVAPGTTIMFHNAGQFLHRLMSSDGSIDTRGIEPGGDAGAIVGVGATAPLALTVTDELLPGVELSIRVVPGATPTTASGGTSGAGEPGPTTTALGQLAHTGSTSGPLLVLGLGIAACGLALARAQRRALRALALVPTGRDHTTTLQRRHDDVLPRAQAPGPAFSRRALGTTARAPRPSPPTTGDQPPRDRRPGGAPRGRRRH